jgi:restriction system protein
MAGRSGNKRGRRRKQAPPFRDTGVRLLLLAVAAWLASLFVRDHPVLTPLVNGLRPLLWLPALLGAVLLGIDFLLSKKSRAVTFPPLKPPPAFARQPRFAEGQETLVHVDTHQATADVLPLATRDAAVAPRQSTWTPDVFATVEWRRFEAVVETLFAQAGFETRSQSHGADGGVDVWLHSKNAEGPVSVVQCKHWQGKPVGVKEMREFFGVMASHGLKRGTYATTSHYTADALAFAKANGINAQDGEGLLRLIAQRTPQQQAKLLEVAYEGEYWKPTCASCGVKMTERKLRNGGNAFWGCVNYPRCKRTQAMPQISTRRSMLSP